MEYYQAYDFILQKLEKELAKDLFFHNCKYTLFVITSVERLALAEGINADFDISILKTAALFCNVGYLKTTEMVQESSCKYAKKYLPYFDYNTAEIELVCSLIMATKPPLKPKTKLEEIICDANQYYLGAAQYHEFSSLLYKEYLSYNLISNFKEWQNYQIEHLKKHIFFTTSAKKACNAVKARSLSQLMQKVDKKLYLKKFLSQFSNLFKRFRLA